MRRLERRLPLLGLALVLAGVTTARAQSIQFDQVPASTSTTSATTSSAVTVSYDGEYGQDGDCTGAMCYAYYPFDYGVTFGTLVVTLDGVGVTANFTPSDSSSCSYGQNLQIYDCAQHGSATGAVNYGVGSHALVATIERHDGSGTVSTSAVFTVAPPPPIAVAVNAMINASVPSDAGLQSTLFMVRNVGASAGTVFLSAACTAGLSTGACTPSLREAYLGINDTLRVRIDFPNMISGASGTATLIASDPRTGTQITSGTSGITVVAPPRAIVSSPTFQTGADFERGLCPTVAVIGPVATQCDAIRATHVLPAVTTYGKTYTPTIAYFSDDARDPNLLVDVTIPNGQSIPATVTVNSYDRQPDGSRVQRWSHTWAGSDWQLSPTRRLNSGALDYSTRNYMLQAIDVEVVFDGAVVGATSGVIAPFYNTPGSIAQGWSMLGLEWIVTGQLGGASVMWYSSDGSSRRYWYAGGDGQSGQYWVARGLTSPDTLHAVANNGWNRLLPNRARVHFNASGLQDSTIDRFGRATTFGYVGTSRQIASITVPGNQTYTFTENGSEVTVLAPGNRVVHLQHATAGAPITAIIDPDGSQESFDYWSTTNLYGVYQGMLAHYRDKRGTLSTFYSEAGGRTLSNAYTQLLGETYIHTSHESRSGRGAQAGPPTYDAALADYIVTDPRGNPTQVWVDSVGGISRAMNALQQVTTIEHGDLRFPGLPTRVVNPNGFAQTTAYDARGHIASTTSWNPLEDTRNATTRYTWDPAWDEIASVTLPEGETTKFGINPATGLRDWVEDGRGYALRTWYYYSADLLLRAIQPPGANCPSSTTSPGCQYFAADTLGNTQIITTETGGRTALMRNAVGQVYRTDVMIQPGVIPVAQTEESSLDAMGRDTLHVSTGPDYNGAGQQQVFLHRTLDASGADSVVDRWTMPDTAGIGHMVTQYRHDAVGRVVQEIAPDNAKDTTLYDLASNVVSITNRNGQTIAYIYDALNRLRSRSLPSVSDGVERVGIPLWMDEASTLTLTTLSSAGLGQSYPWNHPDGYLVPAVVDTMVFDPTTGSLTDANNAYAKVHRTYYPNGELWTETDTIACWSSCSTSHVYADTITYDLNGRRKTLTYPSLLTPTPGAHASYLYASDGFLHGVTDLSGNTTVFDEHPLGTVSTVHFPNGVQRTLNYYADGSLHTDVVTTPQSQQLRNAVFTYDLRGKMLTMDSHPAGGEFRHERMQYDGLGHLYVSAQSDSLFVGNYSDSSKYSLDGFGNNVSRSAVISTQLRGYTDSAGTMPERQHFLAHTGRLWYTQDAGVVIDSASPTSMRAIVNSYDAAGNTLWTLPASIAINNGTTAMTDRRMYYGADGKLWAVDARSINQMGSSTSSFFSFTRAFEEYRYDALGRRVLAKIDRDCDDNSESNQHWGECRVSGIRRTIWDGAQELGEIQVPNAALESDLFAGQPDSSSKNLAEYYGAVAYTFDGRIDQPLAVTRLRYATRGDDLNDRFYKPFTFHPIWNSHGQTDMDVTPALPDSVCGAYADPISNRTCVSLVGEPLWVPTRYQLVHPRAWQGTLLEDKAGAGRLIYRRNRYYDATTGRFTQEDPIGLAGGLNVYGYAGGDPVNYADPFGLCPDPLAPGLGQLQCVLEDAIAGGKQAATNAGNSLVGALHYVKLGVSGTMGHYSGSADVSGDGEGSVGHSIMLNSPNVAASVDIGVKGDVPKNAKGSGSVDVGLGKHLGASGHFYLDSAGKPHPYGATVHVGTPEIMPASPVGATVDLPTGRTP